jgi:hypothetical protein
VCIIVLTDIKDIREVYKVKAVDDEKLVDGVERRKEHQ